MLPKTNYYTPARHRGSGINDLATKMPELAKQWHPAKNNELTADTIPEEWDADTLLKTDFENGFDAGNTSFSLNTS